MILWVFSAMGIGTQAGLRYDQFVICAGIILAAITAVVLVGYLVRKKGHGAKATTDYWIAQSGLGLHERTNNTAPISSMVWKDDGKDGAGSSGGAD